MTLFGSKQFREFIRDLNHFIAGRIGNDNLSEIEVLLGTYSTYLMAEWQASKANVSEDSIQKGKAQIEQIFREYQLGVR